MFSRSAVYLFWCSVLYLTIGMVDLFVFGSKLNPQIQVAWLAALMAPFLIPPWGRWLNMDITWDKAMFEKWFGKKDNDTSNVVPFPELKEVSKVEPPKAPEEPAKIFYRIGVTDKQRVAFSMGYSEITMNKKGCQQMIDQLTVFMNQIEDEDELNSN